MSSKLRDAFQTSGGQRCSDKDRLHHINEGSKTRFQCCENFKSVLLYFRAIQGHTGGEMMAPELLGHVVISYEWKEFLFHRGCSYNVQSILKSGLMAGGRQSKQGRQTIFFTPLNPFGPNLDEGKFSGDFSKPRKAHCERSDHKIKDYSSGRRDLRPSLYAALCRQIASTRWSLKRSTNFLRPDTRRRLYSRVLGNRSSSSQTYWKVQLQQALGNRYDVLNHQPQQLSQHPPGIGKPLREGFEPTYDKEEPEFSSRSQNWGNCPRCDLERRRKYGQDKGSSGQIQSWIPTKKRIRSFRRRGKSKDLRARQYWIARIGTNFQNRPVQFLPEASTRRIDLLWMRHMSPTIQGRQEGSASKIKAMIAPYYAAKMNSAEARSMEKPSCRKGPFGKPKMR